MSAGCKENAAIMPKVRLYSASVAWNFRFGICDKQVYHSLLRDGLLPVVSNKGRELLGVNAVSGFTVYPPKN